MKAKNKIMHVSANRFPKLPESHHTKIIWEELAKNCDEYHVFARSKDMTFSYSQEGKIHLHLVPSFGNRQFVFLFLSFLFPFYCWRYKPTHTVVQCPVLGGAAASLFKNILKFKLFVELHSDVYFFKVKSNVFERCRFHFYRVISKFVFKRADKIRCLSSEMEATLNNEYKFTVGKSIVVANRVDLTKFGKVKSSYEADEIIKIVTVGYFSERKNHLSLIRDLAEAGFPFQLTIVGGGDEQLKLKYICLTSELGLTNALIILENVSHEFLANDLPNFDLYIHYSLSEGVPRAILESMAVGLPVIATRVGYIKDVLIHDENSLIIDIPYNVNLKTSLSRLVKSSSLREKLGRNARLTIVNNYEWNYIFDKYRNAIEQC